MTEKIFTITEEGTNKEFKLVMSFNESNINFNLESKDNPEEKYELKNLSLPDLQKKNKSYKQFDNTLKVADVIANKIEKKNFVLKTGCVLSLKQTNEYDEEEFIPFEIQKVGSSSPSGASSDGLEAEIKRLKSENERYRRENLELKTQIEKLSSGSSKPPKTEPSSAQAKSDQEIVGSPLQWIKMVIFGKELIVV